MNPHRFPILVLLVSILSAVSAQSAAASPASPGRITGFYHVGFWIRDVEKSRAFYKTYLGFDEPYKLNFTDGALQMVVMKVNERQVIYLFPNMAKILPDGDNLCHLGLETDDAAAMHDALAAKGVKVSPAHKGRIGDIILTIRDPDGHVFEITQFEPDGQLLKHRGMSLAPTRISAHLCSVSIAVGNLEASLHFYRDILGFKEIWRDGGLGRAPVSVHLQLPGGTDYLDLRPYERKPGAEPARAVGQFYLDVPNVPQAVATLNQRAAHGHFPPPSPIVVGENGKPQTSVTDPDGTKVVIMEAGTPPPNNEP